MATVLGSAIQNLRDLGLTYTQARIYLAVLSDNPCTFYRISKLTGIARSEIYRETVYLEQAGLVEKSLDRPAFVKAIPVEIALKNFVKWKKRECEERISKLESSLIEFVRFNMPQVKSNRELSPDEIEFSLISTKQAIVTKIKSMIEEAEAEVFLRYLPRKMCTFLGFCNDSINAALRKQVNVRLMTKNEELNDGFIRTIQSTIDVNNRTFEVGYISYVPFGLTVIDKKQLLIETTTEDFFSKKPMLWTDNQLLVSILIKDLYQPLLNCSYRIKPESQPLLTF